VHHREVVARQEPIDQQQPRRHPRAQALPAHPATARLMTSASFVAPGTTALRPLNALSFPTLCSRHTPALRRMCLRECAAGRLGRGQPVLEPTLHPGDALGVLCGVEAEAALRADRLQQPVALLPGAQQFRADVYPAGEFADPQRSSVRSHKRTIHTFYKHLTRPTQCCYTAS
jgi:hypothetical protein